MTPIVGGTAGDIEVLSQVIADAFHDLAVSRWLIPGETARRRIFPAYFALNVQHALAGGVVHTTADRTAVALWIPAPAAQPDGYDERLAAVTGPWASQFRSFEATLDQHRPAGVKHLHLAILAVRPDAQRHGTGTALLRAQHAWLDEQQLPAYLEAASPRSRDLYLRHGYELLPGTPIRLRRGPHMWGMRREPRPHEKEQR